MLPNMEIYNDEISAHRLLTEIQWNISIVGSIGAKISFLFIENHFIRLYPVSIKSILRLKTTIRFPERYSL